MNHYKITGLEIRKRQRVQLDLSQLGGLVVQDADGTLFVEIARELRGDHVSSLTLEQFEDEVLKFIPEVDA
jgi:hypothetical protein